MSYTIDYNEENDFVCVTVTGDFSLASMREMASTVGAVLSERGSRRILNNMLDTVLTESVSEAYYMPAMALKHGVHRSVKRALVVKEITQEFLFLETVFLNSGNIVKMFTDIGDAKQWLLAGNTKDR